MESITDFPLNILTEILCRLPLKSLLICRCVCKTFLKLTSDNPHFSALFLGNAPPSIIIQFGTDYRPSRFLHVVDPELDAFRGFGETVKIKPRCMVPKSMNSFSATERNYWNENNFIIVNSCNGLLYFVEVVGEKRAFACNPITKEYAMVPQVNEVTLSSWLGFSPRTNQYKVLRIFYKYGKDFRREIAVQVHILGSSSWRDIDDMSFGFIPLWDTCSTFLNGRIYWLCKYSQLSKFMLLFDFEREMFGEILPPPSFGNDQLKDKPSMSTGVLGGNLCLTTRSLDIWVMKKYDDEVSWSKELDLDALITMDKPLHGPLRPLQVLSSGEILMNWGDDLVCYDPKRKGLRFLGFPGVKLLGKVVVLTPNLLSLKDALVAENAVEVQKLRRSDEMFLKELIMDHTLVENQYFSRDCSILLCRDKMS